MVSYRILASAALLTALSGCGVNVLSGTEKKDPADDAVILLEKGKPADAINLLEKALADDPGDATMLSVLSLAYAARAGLDPLGFATDMASDATTVGTSSQSGLVALFGVMPKATASNIADVDRAVQILTVDMTREQWLPGDTFKLAIFNTASMVLHLKVLDTNEDGTLSLEEITGLSDTSASGLLSQLTAAKAILAADPDNEALKKAAESVGKYQAQIDAAPGATEEEKLKNYLAQNSGQAVPTTAP